MNTYIIEVIQTDGIFRKEVDAKDVLTAMESFTVNYKQFSESDLLTLKITKL